MSGDLHNLTRDERLDLRPGTVIAYQSGRMLSEIVGTVDTVNETTGSVILDDGTWIAQGDSLRVVTPAGAGAFPHRTEFAPEDQGAAKRLEAEEDRGDGGKSAAAEAGDATAPCKATKRLVTAKRCPDCGQEFAPTSNAQPRCVGCRERRQAARGRGETKPTGKRVPADHTLWLRAVEAVLDEMAAGKSRAVALSEVAARAEFAGLKVNEAKYGYWVLRFRREGKVTRSFSGGTNMAPRLQVTAAKGAPARPDVSEGERAGQQNQVQTTKHALDSALADNQRLREEATAAGTAFAATDEARREALRQIGELKAAYETLKGQYVGIADELRERQKAMEGLERVNGELAKAVARYRRSDERPATDGKTVLTKDVLRDARNLLRRLAVSVVLMEIGEDQCGDLHGLLQAVRVVPTAGRADGGLQSGEEGGEG